MFGFKNKNKETQNIEFLMPVSGNIIDLDLVEDSVFSQRLMGDGFAIEPENGEVYAPVSGEVVSVFPHACGIKTPQGLEVLIHFGIDTVNFPDGFKLNVGVNDKVNAGDLIISADVDYLKQNAPSIVTPIIFTNLADHSFEVQKSKAQAKDKEAIIIK